MLAGKRQREPNTYREAGSDWWFSQSPNKLMLRVVTTITRGASVEPDCRMGSWET
jgi:hypothetical protein